MKISLPLRLGVAFFCFAACVAVRAGGPADVTVVEITEKILVPDCIRFGINLGGDTYYSGAVLTKKRSCENFEGTSYRQCHFGPFQDEGGAATWCRVSEDWRSVLIGGTFTILSGPAKGTTGIVKDIVRKKVQVRREVRELPYFVFDRKVPAGPPNGGLLVERMRLKDGQFRPLDGYWTSTDNKLVIGDVPPGSFGVAALDLDAREGKAHLRFSTHYQRFGQTNGTWHVRFWARAKSGEPTLVVGCDRRYGESRQVELTREWKRHELKLIADRVPEPSGPKENPHLLFLFEANGGEVLLDDVEIWMEGDANPTPFRDDCIETLRKYKPGVLRLLQMGGNTVANTLSPPLQAHSYTSRPWDKVGPYARHRRSPYSLHQMYELCEYLGCEPWYCLPGTLHIEEMEKFIEYLGAPPDVGYGKRRAELGHPKPWTDVFRRIHVEFGNEAWNSAGPYMCGGFNGKDYWRDLIAAAKKSPYYRDNIVFHAGGQAVNAWLNRRIMEDVPNADCLAVAPYILHDFSKADAEALDADDKLFRWAFAWPILRSRREDGAMRRNWELAKKLGKELSVYEINHHITRGDGPLEPRNRIVTSIGGGLNVANTMLMMLKEHRVRTQCLFSLAQHHYNARGVGPVRLWGTALCMRKGHERYRPTFLACALANNIIGGDLVETRHSGADPTFSAEGVFFRRKGRETVAGLPVIWSYAFADGKKRGLILVSLDTSKAHTVEVRFPGRAAGGSAESWLLSAETIAANNEFEAGEPQVAVRREKVADFASGKRVALPPFSMLGLSWMTE